MSSCLSCSRTSSSWLRSEKRWENDSLPTRNSSPPGPTTRRFPKPASLGQEFKAHTDYFERGTAEYLEHAARTGNRTWTFMVYLNEGMEGGGTQFCNIDQEFSPKKGQAVIWNNLYRDGTPNPDTLHHGMPVTRGHKIVITKWFRERGPGPMFYD